MILYFEYDIINKKLGVVVLKDKIQYCLSYFADVLLLEERKMLLNRECDKAISKLNTLNDQVKEIDNKRYTEPAPEKEYEPISIDNLFPYFIKFAISEVILFVVIIKFAEVDVKSFAVKYFIIATIISAVASLAVIIIKNIMFSNEYSRMCQIYRERQDRFSKDKKQESAAVKDEITNVASYKDKIFVLMGTTSKVLDKYYSIDVVASQYRNPDAIAHFFDYFSTSQCDTLTGPDGAYRLYGLESKLETIINQLDTINNKLSVISNTLKRIEHGVMESNAHLASIDDKVGNIENYMSSIGRAIDTQNNILRATNNKLSGIGMTLNNMEDLKKIQIEQEKRYMDYQDFVTRQKRYEAGHLT